MAAEVTAGRNGMITSGFAVGVLLAIGVLLLSVISSVVTGVYVYNRVSADRDAAVASRDRQIAERDAQQAAVLAEYRRHQCIVTGALPKPWPADVVVLRQQLGCP